MAFFPYHQLLTAVLYLYRSPDCFTIGWPMRLDHDFFFVILKKKSKDKKKEEKEKKKKKKKEKKDEDEPEEPEVIL